MHDHLPNESHWITIPPLTDDEHGPLRGAAWIGPAGIASAQADRILAVATSFTLPAGRRIAGAVLHYWVDGRGHFDPTFPVESMPGWTSVRVNGRSETPFGELVRILAVQAVKSVKVGHLLQAGTNHLSLLSWMSLPDPAVIVAIEVRFADGGCQWVRSDASWRCQVLTIDQARAVDWDQCVSGSAIVRCAFGAEPWSDVRARLNHPQQPVVLRHAFTLPQRPISQATLAATAIGVYDLDLNGRRVGDACLAPGWTDARSFVHVQHHDVTSLLQPGANQWTATVAKGWIGSPMQGCTSMREDTKALRAELVVRYADGETIRIRTGAAGWEGCTGPVRDSEIYNGETVDLTHELRWRPAIQLPERPTRLLREPCAQPHPVAELAPVSIRAQGAAWIVDFGQNFAGVVRLRLEEPRGTRVVLRHGEGLLRDGGLMTVNLREAACTDRLVCPGGAVTFQPRFTFRGFRYVEITGLSRAPTPDEIRGIAISSVSRRTLELDLGSAQLNRLSEMIRWTQLSNWLSVPTDCPQRSERLAWQGDNQLYAPSGLLLYDGAAFQTKHVEDVLEAAHADGSPPEFAPCGGGAGPTPSYAYADAVVTISHAIWRITGDLALPRRRWAGICAYLDSLDRSADAEGLVVHGSYGDWLTTEPKTPHAILAPLMQVYVLRLAAELADALGDPTTAARCRRRADEVGVVWRRRHLRADGTIESDTQTVYIWAWHTGVVPEPMRPRVRSALRAAFARHDDHIRTGICGTARVLDTLMDAGLDDVAWRILSDDTFPSYGYFLKNGATTMPEWWDAWPDGNEITEYWQSVKVDRANGEIPGSLNHPVFGAVLEGLVAYVWGLRQAPGSVGYQHVVIAPRFTGRLPAAQGCFHAVRGTYRLAWQRQGDGVRFVIDVPQGCCATLVPPQAGRAPIDLGPGHTEIVV